MSGPDQRLVFVTPVPPSPHSTSGFSVRVHHFAMAAAERMHVTIVLIKMPGYDSARQGSGAHASAQIGARELEAPRAPWSEPTFKGRMLRRLWHYPFDPLPFDCYPHDWPRLREVLAEERPTVVAFYLPVLAHLADHAPPGVPVVGVLEEGWERLVHASLEGSEWKRGLLSRREAQRFATVYKRLGRRASAVVAISAEEREWFTRTIDPAKISVIAHGVDTTYFAPRDGAEPDIDVLVVGDLRSPRNHVGAVRTWEAARATPEAESWRWVFVGAVDPGVEAVLRSGGATVTGMVDDVRPYYERARSVLVPALEGTGVKGTSIQAWAMRRPLVTSRVGARSLPARDGENALIGADPPALVGHLITVLGDPELAERLAAEGRRTAAEECDLSRTAHRFADLCLGAAGSRAARPQEPLPVDAR